MQTQAAPQAAKSVQSLTGPTLNDFQHMVNGMTQEHQLTQEGKLLVNGREWTFAGDDYRRAWGILFDRARQLNLRYCKHFKRFYKPLPPKPSVGDRVRLTGINATGVVTGYERFDIRVQIDGRRNDVIVGVEYLEKLY